MTTPEQSGLTIDGVAIPLSVEADGPTAIAAHLAVASRPAAPPSTPPHEGTES